MSTHPDGTGTDDRLRTEDSATGTSTGADVTSRMAGTHRADAGAPVGRHALPDSDLQPGPRYEERARVLPAKTSAAATFALVFGLAALFSALTAVLAPLGVLFGVIGLVLGFLGLKMARRTGVTGKGVALGGLLTALLGLLLGGAVLAGAAVVVNDEAQLDRIQERLDQIRDDLPSAGQIRDDITG